MLKNKRLSPILIHCNWYTAGHNLSWGPWKILPHLTMKCLYNANIKRLRTPPQNHIKGGGADCVWGSRLSCLSLDLLNIVHCLFTLFLLSLTPMLWSYMISHHPAHKMFFFPRSHPSWAESPERLPSFFNPALSLECWIISMIGGLPLHRDLKVLYAFIHRKMSSSGVYFSQPITAKSYQHNILRLKMKSDIVKSYIRRLQFQSIN